MKILTVLIILFALNSCKKETEDKITENPIEKNDLKISKKDIETINYIEYDLSVSSKKALDSWKSYLEIQNLIELIKENDLSYFQSDKEIQQSLLNDLSNTIPDRIKSEAIEARVKVLKTKFFKLKSSVLISDSKQEITTCIKEFFIAFSNLNLQINKKLEKEAQDILKPTL